MLATAVPWIRTDRLDLSRRVQPANSVPSCARRYGPAEHDVRDLCLRRWEDVPIRASTVHLQIERNLAGVIYDYIDTSSRRIGSSRLPGRPLREGDARKICVAFNRLARALLLVDLTCLLFQRTCHHRKRAFRCRKH